MAAAGNNTTKDRMTPRERMIAAIRNRVPDRVPTCPDISNMIPARLTGRPFWDIYLHGSPPLWQAYIDAVRHFGIDGWFFYGDMGFRCAGPVEVESSVVGRTDERIVQRSVVHTPAGDLHTETTFYSADPPTPTEKPVKSIRDDFDKLRYLYGEIIDCDTTTLDQMRQELGELGAFGVAIGYPGFQQWFGMVQGGVEELSYVYFDHPEIIEEWRYMEHRRSVRMMELILDKRPDFVLLGGSGSITLQSPGIFRELCLPTIKELTRMASEAGIPTMLHSCGKERALVEMCALETDLNCINPLEVPPMGDCDLAEVKRSFGDKLSLMGNLHTTELMLKGTPEQVQAAAVRCIEDAAEGGGFILSTGDQCGRDTPDANILKLVEVCEGYGRY